MENAFTLTAASLSIIVGTVITVLSIIIPGLNVWFASQTPSYKRMVMSLLGLGISAAIVGFSCFTAWVIIPCTQPEWWRTGIDVVLVWVGFVTANQSVYEILPKPQNVTTAIVKSTAERDAKVLDNLPPEEPQP